jgi:hypothetical protein
MHVRFAGLGATDTPSTSMVSPSSNYWCRLLGSAGGYINPACVDWAAAYQEAVYGKIPTPAQVTTNPATGGTLLTPPPAVVNPDTSAAAQAQAEAQTASVQNAQAYQQYVQSAESQNIQAAEDAGTYTPSGDLLSDWVDLTSGALSLGDFLAKYWWIPVVAIGGVAFIAYSKK